MGDDRVQNRAALESVCEKISRKILCVGKLRGELLKQKSIEIRGAQARDREASFLEQKRGHALVLEIDQLACGLSGFSERANQVGLQPAEQSAGRIGGDA